VSKARLLAIQWREIFCLTVFVGIIFCLKNHKRF
jgi:hypothetical protein